jgi:putative SOS response-associated peptidase YedK
MCGRFTLTTPAEALAEAFGLDEPPEAPPRYNIAPTQPIAVVRRIPAGAPRTLSMLKWGLVPTWSNKEPRGRTLLINARAESLIDKPSFRDAFERRRCLVPASGFYEWRSTPAGKEAYLLRRQSGGPFAFAGLWEPPNPREPGSEATCAIVTTDPNELLRPIHDRMPVILAPEDWDRWLDPETRRTGALRALLRPCAPEYLTALRVGPAVNNATNETPDCAQPVA